jgi:hypothetical protein
MGLSLGDPHQIGRRRGRQSTAIEPRQNINPIQLSLAHQHPTIGSAASKPHHQEAED